MKIEKQIQKVLISTILSLLITHGGNGESCFQTNFSYFHPFSANITNHLAGAGVIKAQIDPNNKSNFVLVPSGGLGFFKAKNPAWNALITYIPFNLNLRILFIKSKNKRLYLYGGPGYYTTIGIANERTSSLGFDYGVHWKNQFSDNRALDIQLAFHRWAEELYWQGASDFIELSVGLSFSRGISSPRKSPKIDNDSRTYPKAKSPIVEEPEPKKKQIVLDKKPPQITITSPVELKTKRRLQTESNNISLIGIVSDESGVKNLYYNNKSVMIDGQGRFIIELSLNYRLLNLLS